MKNGVLIVTPVGGVACIPAVSLSYPRLVVSIEPFSPFRDICINATLSRAQQEFRKLPRGMFDFVVVMDSDVVVTDKDVEALIEAVESKGGAPCADTKNNSDGSHVFTSCVAMKAEDWLKIDYMKNPYSCPCSKVPSPYYLGGVCGYEQKYF